MEEAKVKFSRFRQKRKKNRRKNMNNSASSHYLPESSAI